jgi:hypothetical protein
MSDVSVPLQAELNEALSQVERLVAERQVRRASWERTLAERISAADLSNPTQWQVLSVGAARAEAATLTTLDDQSVLATRGIQREIYVIDIVPLAKGSKVGSLRLRFIPHESLPKSGPGLATNGNLLRLPTATAAPELAGYDGDSAVSHAEEA